MTTLLIATRNGHKAEEIRAILSDRFRYLTLRDFPGAPEVIEDATTFVGNSTKKAVELAQWMLGSETAKINSPFFVLADDSGLEVDALQGAPGVYSARFAALDSAQSGNSSDQDNNAKLLRLMSDVPLDQRTARFRCVLALTSGLDVKRETLIFEGTCEGHIGFAPSGGGGFGYDPLFIPSGYQQSFAELGAETKNQLSHRAKALATLRAHLDSSAASGIAC